MSVIVRRVGRTSATVLKSTGDVATVALPTGLSPQVGDLVDVAHGRIVRVVKRAIVKERP